MAEYKDSNGLVKSKYAFDARTKLNHENYICCLRLTSQIDILNLLTVSINSDRNRLQCRDLVVDLKGNMQKFMNWLKDNVLCNEFYITNNSDLISNYDAELLGLFMTGANCTSQINVTYYDISQVVVDFVQKFMELRNCDDFHTIQSVDSTFWKCFSFIEALKLNYAEFIVKQDQHYIWSEYIFEFINNDIERKLKLTVKIFNDEERTLIYIVVILMCNPEKK